MIIDEKFKNCDFVFKLYKKYDNKRVMILFYHLQINEMIEKKHIFLIDAFSKIIENDEKKQIKQLLTVLWICQLTVRVNVEKTFLIWFAMTKLFYLLKLNISFEKICFETK